MDALMINWLNICSLHAKRDKLQF